MNTNYDEMQNEVIQAYTNLLEIQYNGLPKAVETVKLHCKTLLANMLLWQIRNGFDIETAVGYQLDIIGMWEGIDRYFAGASYEDKLWLAYYHWDEAPNNLQGCYKDWNNETAEDGAYLNYNDIISATNRLSDNDFRTLLKLKIAKNTLINTNKNIDDTIHNIFGNLVYTTWGVQQVTYHYNNSLYSIIRLAQLKNCLLAPTGCQIILDRIF